MASLNNVHVSIPFKRERLSEQKKTLSESEQTTSIPFKRERLSEHLKKSPLARMRVRKVSIPFKRERLSERGIGS